MKSFKTFMEIKVGGIEKENLLAQLQDTDVHFNNYARILINSTHFELSKDVQILSLVKLSLAELGIEEKHIDSLASDALEQQRLLVNNPKAVSLEDAKEIYHNALSGQQNGEQIGQ